VEIVPDKQQFTNAEELVGRFNKGGYDDWVIVAPLSVLSRVCELCEDLNLKKPLFAKMEVLPLERQEEADLIHNNRPYRFVEFRRIERLTLEFGETF